MCRGKEPSQVQLFAHIHCRKIDGKSLVVAQIEAAMKEMSGMEENNENGDGDEIRAASTEEICVDIPDLDINSLQFTNTTSHNVYHKVRGMMADEANSDTDESNMFLSAYDGPSHDRVRGLGSMLPNKVQTTTTRSGPTHTASSISSVTNNGAQTMFTRAEVGMLLADCNRHQEDEKAERETKMATYDLYFNQLFTWLNVQKPNFQAQATTSRTEQAAIGDLPTLQGQRLPFQLSTDGVSHISTPISHGIPFLMQPNQGGTFQALLNQASIGNDALVGWDQWWGNLPPT